MSPVRRLLILIAIVVGGLVVAAPPASAHADLVASNPYDGSVLPVQPAAVTLQFTEAITVQADGVRVIDGAGTRVDEGRSSTTGQEIVAPLRDDLEVGTYVVAWRAVSADGHPVRGAFTFSVGQRTDVSADLADSAFAASADRRDEVVGAVLRYVSLLGILGASGLVLVGGRLRRPEEESPVTRLVGGFAIVGLVGLVLQVPVQASLATGRGWTSITESGVASLALADGVGLAMAISGIGLLCVLVTIGLPFAAAPRAVALSGAIVAPLGLAVTGHTRTMSPAAVGYLADAVHAVAGALWFGGLLALLHVVRLRRQGTDDLGAADAVRRFSSLALWAVAAVAVAGSALAWIEVGGLGPLTSTGYGRMLLVKVALVLVVVGLGAWNRQRLMPGLPDADPDPGAAADPDVAAGSGAGTLPRVLEVVAIEVLVLCLVLATTAVLTNMTPAKDARAGGPVSATAPLGDGTMEVTVDPARPGRNDIHVFLKDAEGTVDRTYEEATFRLALPSQELGPIERDPVLVAPGHFQLVGADLPLPGEWTLTVVVQPDRFTETSGTARFTVG